MNKDLVKVDSREKQDSSKRIPPDQTRPIVMADNRQVRYVTVVHHHYSQAQLGSPKRSVGVLLGIGIFFIPYIFAWFTLREGHSSVARWVAFIWLGLQMFGSCANLSKFRHGNITVSTPIIGTLSRLNPTPRTNKHTRPEDAYGVIVRCV